MSARVGSRLLELAVYYSPIALLVKRGDRYLTVPVAWHGGLRWPWLERTGEREAGLDRLLAPRAR